MKGQAAIRRLGLSQNHHEATRPRSQPRHRHGLSNLEQVMMEIVRCIQRNVKRWSSGKMALRRPRSRYRPRQHHYMALEVDLLGDGVPTQKADTLFYLSKEAFKRHAIDDLWRVKAATSTK